MQRQKREEQSDVSSANTVVDPGAVVIKPPDTSIAQDAVSATSFYFTLSTEIVRLVIWILYKSCKLSVSLLLDIPRV